MHFIIILLEYHLHVTITFTHCTVFAPLITVETLTAIGPRTMAITAIGNADGLTSHVQRIRFGAGVTQHTDAFIWLIADLVAGAAHFTNGLTVTTTGI